MVKKIYDNKQHLENMQLVLPENKGGTGSTNIQGVLNQLDIVPNTSINQPNGVAGLNSFNRLNEFVMPPGIGVGVIVNGAPTVNVSTSNTYTIMNYSHFDTYTISVSAGNVSRTNNEITFVAPGSAQTVTLTINSIDYHIDVTAVTADVDTPSITSPVTGAINLGPTISFTGSAFAVTGGSDTHEGTDWQIATDSGFTNVVASTTNDTVNKTSWTSSALQANTTYYARVRYKGTVLGYSNYSANIVLSTKVNFIPSTEEAAIAPLSPITGAQFGNAVAISQDGSRVIVGAYGANSGTGKAYIFVRSGTSWSLEADLLVSDPSSSAKFGTSVSITNDGSRVAVGAAYINSNTGRAYIFSRSGTTWTQESILPVSSATTASYFGYSIAISGDGTRCIVGSPFHRHNSTSVVGLVSIFVRSGTTWTEEAILAPSDGIYGYLFGNSVSMDSNADRVAIGAYGAEYNSVRESGKAYVFSRSGTTWTEEAILHASDAAISDYLGWSIAISGDGTRCIVGSYTADYNSITDTGKAYIFSRSGTTWSQEAMLHASDIASYDNFGWSVSIDTTGDNVIVGSPNSDFNAITETGKAYIFSRSGTTWTERTILNASNYHAQDYFGLSTAISGDGTRVISGAYGFDEGSYNLSGIAYIFS